MKSRSKEAGRRQKTKKADSHLKTLQYVCEVDEELFNEMLRQVKMLMGFKGDCSGHELRQQFQNLSTKTVSDFLLLAMKRRIIKEEPVGTFILNT